MKVMTLNIWNYNDPWQTRFHLITDLIESLQPDVIGLQEIRYDKEYDLKRNQAEQIAERLKGYQFVYEKAQIDSDAKWEGLAIFSKYDILDSNSIQLSRDMKDDIDQRHQRIVLRASIDSPSGRFHFFNTHLTLSYKARNRVITEVVDFFESYESRLPKVIVGDFNSAPDQEPIKFMTSKISLNDRKTSFQDAWTEIHGDKNGFTYCVGDFKERRDYIFLTPVKDADVGQIIDCELIADQPDENGVYPSDHYGLITTIRLEPEL